MKKLDTIIPILTGLIFLSMAWFMSTSESEMKVFNLIFSIILSVFGTLFIFTPISSILERFKLMRIVYRTLQVITGIFFLLMSAYIIVAKVFFSIVFPIIFMTIIGAKLITLIGYENAQITAYFYAFTFTAIIFSFWGNLLIRKTYKLFGGSKETVKRELSFAQLLLGQDQIKYGIYILYFVLLLFSTNLEMFGEQAEKESYNLITATLQSFAVFLAFETLVEKRGLLKPYGEFWTKLKNVYTDIKNTPSDEIFKSNNKEE